MCKKFFAVTAALLSLTHASAHAKIVLDVTPTASTTASGTDTSGSGFIVTNTAIQPTGTGVIDPFLTIQETGQERGFNTDVGEPLDTKRSGGGFTRAIQLGEIATVQIGGVEYLQFLLDVNQDSNGPISLNQIQFFVSPADVGSNYSLTEATQGIGTDGTGGNDAIIGFGPSATEVFRMNNLENNGTDLVTNTEIQIDSAHGSGSGDMFLYVQSSLFGTDLKSYVTLFSQFGRPNGTYSSTAGFEEWAFVQGSGPTVQPVPEPATMALVLSGLIPFGILKFGRLRRRSAATEA